MLQTNSVRNARTQETGDYLLSSQLWPPSLRSCGSWLSMAKIRRLQPDEKYHKSNCTRVMAEIKNRAATEQTVVPMISQHVGGATAGEDIGLKLG